MNTKTSSRFKVQGSRLVLLASLLFSAMAGAQTSVPQYLNFQSVVMDDSGNLITVPFIDLNFKILDKDGNLLYEEDQKQVQVLKGAVNVMIGEGTILNSSSPTGGITMEAIDPREGTHFLRVTIGNNQPLNDMELLSTPYAMYAEQALSIPTNTITSEHIIDGTIKLIDLEPGLAFSNLEGMATESQLPASLATDTELSAHINSTTAHAAANITVRGPFLASDADNLEEVLRSLDRRVMNFYNNNQEFLGNETTLRETAETTLQTNINSEATTRANTDITLQTNINNEATTREAALSAEESARILADTAETTARTAADTAEATTRGTADSTLQSNIDTEATTRASEDQRVLDSEISRAGDTIYGDLTFFTDDTLADQTMTLAPSTGNITTDGEISVLGGMVSVERDSVSGEPILLIEDIGGVERLRFNAETGSLTVDGQMVLTGTVDGVDVSTLDSDFDVHTTATTAHGSNGAVVGVNTLNSAISSEATTRGNEDSALQTLANTAQSTADSKVSKSGDTMTGDLNMDTDANCIASLGRTCRVDGVNVSSHNHSGSGQGGTINYNNLSNKPVFSTYIRTASLTIPVNEADSPNCRGGGSLWFCTVSASCDSGDVLTGCTGHYSHTAWGEDAAQFQGAYPSGNTCTAEASQHSIENSDTPTLRAYAICTRF